MSYRCPNILGLRLFTSATGKRTAIENYSHQQECAGTVCQPRGKPKLGKTNSFHLRRCIVLWGWGPWMIRWYGQSEGSGDLGGIFPRPQLVFPFRIRPIVCLIWRLPSLQKVRPSNGCILGYLSLPPCLECNYRAEKRKASNDGIRDDDKLKQTISVIRMIL